MSWPGRSNATGYTLTASRGANCPSRRVRTWSDRAMVVGRWVITTRARSAASRSRHACTARSKASSTLEVNSSSTITIATARSLPNAPGRLRPCPFVARQSLFRWPPASGPGRAGCVRTATREDQSTVRERCIRYLGATPAWGVLHPTRSSLPVKLRGVHYSDECPNRDIPELNSYPT